MIVWNFLRGGGWILILLAAAGTFVKMYGDSRAENALLKRDAQQTHRTTVALLDSLGVERERWRVSDSLLRAVRVNNATLAHQIDTLKAQRDTARAERNLARAALAKSDSMVLVARAAVDTTILDPVVLQLINAERRVGENAKADAAACDKELGKCDREVDNLSSQIAGKDIEIREQSKQLSEKTSRLRSLEINILNQDSIIKRQDRQLHPGIFKQLEKDIPKLLLAVLAGFVVGKVGP